MRSARSSPRRYQSPEVTSRHTHRSVFHPKRTFGLEAALLLRQGRPAFESWGLAERAMAASRARRCGW
jgi:hypothetical protein